MLSIAAHAGVLFALTLGHVEPPAVIEPEPMVVTLVDPPKPPAPAPTPAEIPAAAPTPEPAAQAVVPTPTPPKPSKPPPKRTPARRAPPSPDVVPIPAGEGTAQDSTGTGVSDVSESELAGALTAGSGSPGGACNMAAWLQQKLRKDRQVQAAVAQAHDGKAILVWNGKWIRRGDEEGAGLAAVREAIMWEVAFAPAACRAQPVRGLVLISMNDGPGAARVVMGQGHWRWSDMLFSGGAMTPTGLR